MKEGRHLTLAIESSCDETAAAVVAEGRSVLSNIISSQIDVHKEYGGVVPEIASRHHLTNINHVLDRALREAGVTWDQIDTIGVTEGPGLIGALVIGIATAKAIALATGKPLVGVHHIHGHICANFVEYPELEPPFLALVVSGGHTSIVQVEDYNRDRVLGETRDDAAGEAFDKVARVLGLGYPGGPKIDAIAREGDPSAIPFKRVWLEEGSYDFSFSGIKTAVLNYIHGEKQAGREILVSNVAASFQEAVLEVIVTKAVDAASHLGQNKLVLAGGVAANSRLREMLTDACREQDMELFVPSADLCTDNAAMIACAAYYKWKAKGGSLLDMDGVADLSLEDGAT